MQQKRMEAVYYYIRSLMAANPVHTDREPLLSLLHHASSKVGDTLGGVTPCDLPALPGLFFCMESRMTSM